MHSPFQCVILIYKSNFVLVMYISKIGYWFTLHSLLPGKSRHQDQSKRKRAAGSVGGVWPNSTPRLQRRGRPEVVVRAGDSPAADLRSMRSQGQARANGGQNGLRGL